MNDVTMSNWVQRPKTPIPSAVRDGLRARLERHAAGAWPMRCERVTLRFRGGYAYVAAVSRDRLDVGGPASKDRGNTEEADTRLCRLGYLGSADRWAFAFYKYSDDTYEPSFLPTGSFEGSPEEAFDCAAQVYLQGRPTPAAGAR